VTLVYTTMATQTGTSGNATRTSSSNTGAIAGGAVGGAVGLALIVLLLWFCIRKRKKDDFDGDFDPDHIDASPGRDPTLPRLDMDVTPYAYDPNQGGAVDDPNGRPMYDMAQRSDGSAGFLLAGAVRAQTPPFSDIHGNQTSTTGSHYPPSSSGHGLLSPGLGDPRDSSSRSSSNPIGSLPSAKEREAADRRRLYVANEFDRSGSSGDVIQHQDGGRVQLDRIHDEPQREIPPSYDSIGPDHNR